MAVDEAIIFRGCGTGKRDGKLHCCGERELEGRASLGSVGRERKQRQENKACYFRLLARSESNLMASKHLVGRDDDYLLCHSKLRAIIFFKVVFLGSGKYMDSYEDDMFFLRIEHLQL